MASGSRIDTTKIDETFPKSTGVNSVQGFRDNFAAIKQNLDTAALELTRLQSKYLDVSGDVGGFSGDVGNTDRPVISLKLTLAETGVTAGRYRNPLITVDAKGRVLGLEDGTDAFLAATGGTLDGDLAVTGSITLPNGGTVAGRDLARDGQTLDALTAGQGVVVMTPAGPAHRRLVAANGLTFAEAGEALRVGLEGFRLTFEGDLEGSVAIRDFADTTVRLTVTEDAMLRVKRPKFAAPLDMQGYPVNNVGEPQHGYQVGDRNYNDGRYLMGTAAEAQGLVVGRGRGTESQTREITGRCGVLVENGDGVAGNPVLKARDFVLKLIGDVSGSAIVKGLNDTEVRVRLLNAYTKAEANSLFVPTRGGTLEGDLVVTGNLTATTVAGRDLAADGAILDSLRTGAGLLVQKEGRTFGRITLLGEDHQIQVTNGDGLSGHPVIGLMPNPRIPGHAQMVVPFGTASSRPTKPVAGGFRFNTATQRFEGYQDSRWASFLTPDDVPVSYAELSGVSIVWNVSTAATMSLRLGRDTTVADAINLRPGAVYRMIVHQDAEGGHALTFGPRFKFSGPREVSQTPDSLDIFEFVSDGQFLYGHLRAGYA